ncbi:MAG: MBL fold metallo-hydrolase, partial [Candidatus Dormibacteraceae bacterium]
RLGGTAVPMRVWEEATLTPHDGGGLRVTALPAEHGPAGTMREPADVIGFLLQGEDLPTVYVSGDNASVEVVRDIVERLGGADVAILFAGAAMVPRLPGVPLTLTAERAVEAARVLDARRIVPVHFEGWAHFSEDAEALREAFQAAGLADRVTLLRPGEEVTISI